MADYTGFDTRYIGEYQTALRLDLNDGSTLWSNSELNRAVERAVADLDRYYPLEAIYEHTIVQTVTDEAWTSDETIGTYVTLSNNPIEPGSESVEDPDGNVCTRDTDYTIDYVNGRITHIDGGEIGDDEECTISYKKEKLGIDVSAIISNLIRITHVEYPHDQVPQQKVTFSIYNSFMYIGSQAAGKSQTYLADGKHIIVYYEMPHTTPAAGIAPTYPAFLDQVICVGAGAYALLTKAIQYEHQAVTDFAAARTAIGNIAAVHVLLKAALALADTQLDASLYYFTKVDVALDAIATTIGLVNTYLTSDTAPSSASYLKLGDDTINTVNLGADVAGQYANYAARCSEMAAALEAEADAYAAEANVRLSESDRWVNAGRAWVEQAGTYIAEVDRYLGEADRYITMATENLGLADRFRAEGQQRLAGFQRVLEDRTQYRKRMSSVPVIQPPGTGTQGTATLRTDRI